MLPVFAVAQTADKVYYMFPVRPGQENYLSGTMGELRSTHFHTAIDIKTSGITGLPIYASAEGYIQRIKVSIGGYGNALYLRHPNGTTTVYAHLEAFQEDIAAYVRKEQYKKESFVIDLFPPKERFRFKKGDVIALSGNSGSSSGPHLHFEIRDAQQRVLDPLQYGFDEIKDNLAPTLEKIAFVTRDKESRINGMFGRFEFKVIEKDETYVIEEPITLFGNIGVEVYAYDRFNGARNRNGIVNQTLFLDYQPIFSQHIERLSFNKARNILVHMNYKRMRQGGRRFNKYYKSDGNLLNFYSIDKGDGTIQILDPFEHNMDIRLEDSYGNVSQYHFNLNDEGFSKSTDFKDMYFLNKQGFDVQENVLEMVAKPEQEDCFARIFVQGNEHILAHSYKTEDQYFYLWELENGLPDSAQICEATYRFNFTTMLPSGTRQSFDTEDFDIQLKKYGLFDTLYLRHEKSYDQEEYREYFNFMHPEIPMRQSARVTLKPAYVYDTARSNVYAVNGKGKLAFAGGEWQDGNISFDTRDLVQYTIATDTIPPEIKRLKSNDGRVRFKIEDEMSGISSFRAEIDNNWVLMNFDGKSGLLWSDPKLELRGNFELAVKDNAGNFTRLNIEL